DHRVDGVFELEDLALHVDGNLLRQVPTRHSGGDFGDVAHLAGEVAGHGVHVVGEVFPGAGNTFHLGLPAEPTFGAHLAGDARHFGGERVELVHHRVDGILELEDLSADFHGDLLGQVATRHRGCHFGDVAHLAGQSVGHQLPAGRQSLLRAGDTFHLGLSAELTFGADLARDAAHFGREGVELVDHRVDGVLEVEDLALHVDSNLLGQVARSHGGGDLGNVTDLTGEVRGHEVHVVGEVLPCAANARDLGLTAEFALGTHLAGHTRHFAGERVELVDHRIDGVLELQDLALHVHGDLLGQVTARHRRGHLRDVADLAGEVGRHRVHIVGEVLPGASDAGHLRLSAQLAFGTHLA